MEPLNLALKFLEIHIWSCGQTDFRGFPHYQSDMWATIDNLFQDMLPFLLCSPLCFPKKKLSVGIHRHEFPPQLPPAPSLPQKLTLSCHTSDLRRLYYSSYIWSSYCGPDPVLRDFMHSIISSSHTLWSRFYYFDLTQVEAKSQRI